MTETPFTIVTTCVGFDDLLAVTLPLNCQWPAKTVVITSCEDAGTIAVVAKCDHQSDVQLHVTGAFRQGGAEFNKGAALSEVLDRLSGWVLLVDADIVLPTRTNLDDLDPECVYNAFRRMLLDPLEYRPDLDWITLPEGPERTNNEYPGYAQAFHLDCSRLRDRPVYPTDWKHAGGSDSFFVKKYPPEHRRRLPFEVLHLGTAGVNWCGRVTPRLDGTEPPNAMNHSSRMTEYRVIRTLTGSYENELITPKAP